MWAPKTVAGSDASVVVKSQPWTFAEARANIAIDVVPERKLHGAKCMAQITHRRPEPVITIDKMVFYRYEATIPAIVAMTKLRVYQ